MAGTRASVRILSRRIARSTVSSTDLPQPTVVESIGVAHRYLFSCVLAFLLLHAVAFAGERWTIGLSTSGAAIEAVAIDGRSASSPTVLLVGGLQQPDQSSDAVDREAAAFERV